MIIAMAAGNALCTVRVLLATVLMALISVTLHAQTLTGLTDYPALGVRFTIPDGWVGQETNAGLILGSNTEAGLILIVPHAYQSIAQVKQAAVEGIVDEGLALQIDGPVQSHSRSMVGAPFKGLFQGQAARAWAVASLNPRGGGLSVMALTTKEAWTETLKQRAITLADSVEYFEPDNSADIAEWKRFLGDVRLTDMSSSYSSGASVDGYSTYSGSSSETRLHLCAAGHYKYGHQSSFSIDSGGGFANSADADQGSGRWDVISDAGGTAILTLTSHEGERYEFPLSYEDGKTFLNGTRYFRTLPDDPNGYGPDCP